MKTIPLTQGKVAIIDDEDYENIAKYKWSAIHGKKTFYAVRSTKIAKRTTIIMHRVIMNAQKGDEIDHRDGDGLNNRKWNLRFATDKQQAQNRKKYKKASSKFKGVCFNKDRKLWQVQIDNNYKHKRLGYFKDEIEAALAYDKKAIELFGEFAKLNILENPYLSSLPCSTSPSPQSDESIPVLTETG